MTANSCMPYNTRRKSLSLPSLGIHVPGPRSSVSSFQPSAHNRSQSSHMPGNSTMSSSSLKRVFEPFVYQPTKKHKRGPCITEQTPPPSPGRNVTDNTTAPRAIDLEGINDNIVECVILQLQATGNKRHTVKELAAVLMQRLRIVQQSANPAAIISSRLGAYLKQPCWTALSPCPIAKELEAIHPRRTYFYLTTCPPQPCLADSKTKLLMTPPPPNITTPSISDDEDNDHIARRRYISPSPEVDLSSPDLDDPEEVRAHHIPPSGPLLLPQIQQRLRHTPQRGARVPSPALEKDEREFTQTFAGLQKRKLTGALLQPLSVEVEDAIRQDTTLFCEPRSFTIPPQHDSCTPLASSPGIRPSLSKKGNDSDAWAQSDGMLEWVKNPEKVGLEELDCLFDSF